MDRFFSRYVNQASDIAHELVEKGFFKFDIPVNYSDCKEILRDRIDSTSQSNYVSGAQEVVSLIDALAAESLTNRVAEEVEDLLGIKLSRKGNHHVLRSVKPGDGSEAFRGHFDSHALTILLPLQIPSGGVDESGELFFLPLARRWPKSEIENIIGKIIWKLKLVAFGFDATVKKSEKFTKFNFKDGCPIIFLGKICFHGNYPLGDPAIDFRHTVLAHFYDDSGPISLAELTRKLRRRGA